MAAETRRVPLIQLNHTQMYVLNELIAAAATGTGLLYVGDLKNVQDTLEFLLRK